MMKDIVGNALGKCLVHDDLILTGFVIEDFLPQKGRKSEEVILMHKYDGSQVE